MIDSFDQFGTSVTCMGDLDGDGVVDLAVEARDDDDGGLHRVAVWLLIIDFRYLFMNTDGTVKVLC